MKYALLIWFLCCSCFADGIVQVTGGNTTTSGTITGPLVVSGTSSITMTNGGSYGNYGTGATNSDGYYGDGSHLTGIASAYVAPGAHTTVSTNGSVYTVAYDPTDESYADIDEEFFSNNANTSSIGTYSWTVGYSGGTINANTASLSGHPGIVIISASAAGTGEAIQLGDSGTPTKKQFQDLGTQVPWKMRMGFMLTSTNVSRIECGLNSIGGNNNTNASTTLIGAVYDSAVSSSLTFQTGDGTVSSTNLATMQANVWYDVLIQSVTAGQVYAQVNGGSFVTNTTHIPSAQLIPVFRVGISTATSTSLDIDYWKGHFSMPARYP